MGDPVKTRLRHKKSLRTKTERLGMSYVKAYRRLIREIVFQFFSDRLKRVYCYRCGKEIDHISDFHIDHKIPWLWSDNPVSNFFNIDNLAASHSACNIRDCYRAKGLTNEKKDP